MKLLWLTLFIPYCFAESNSKEHSLKKFFDGKNERSVVVAQLPSGGISFFKSPKRCVSTVIANCNLSASASGVLNGTCASAYAGSCSYRCFRGTWTQQSNSCVFAENPCTLPWGGSLVHGGSVTAYAASSVACGNSCSGETRTCSNGVLSGSNTAASCSVASCYTWQKIDTTSGSVNCSPSNPSGQTCSSSGSTCLGLPTATGPHGITYYSRYRCQ